VVDILQKEDPVLRKQAATVPVEAIPTPETQKVIRDMKNALMEENVNYSHGVALAAPQIGILLRMFIVSGKIFSENAPDKTFINPQIVKTSRKTEEMHEGCLSVRHMYGTVIRHLKVKVRAYDERGKRFTVGASGLLAQIFQHEVDHLNGILFTDKATHVEETKNEEQ